jgi:lipoate-protein ligase A
MEWLLFNSGKGEAAANMAADEALLAAVSGLQRPVLRFYGWTERAATFGYFQKYAEVAAITGLRPLIRRPTGGGIVPHDFDWTYSAAFPPGHEWYELKAEESYRRIHDWLRLAFERLKIPTELAPCCKKTLPGQCFIGYEKFDLLWHGKKIAGAAQRRNKCGLLIQGSVQAPFASVTREQWEQAMAEVAVEQFGVGWKPFANDAAWSAAVDNLVREKYSQAGFNQKR